MFSNPHVLEDFDKDLIDNLHVCSFMSELDTKCNWKLFGYESEEQMAESFSVDREEIRQKVHIPMLLVQPLDDPLHKVVQLLSVIMYVLCM